MSKYQVKGVDQAAINAELRKEFGSTVTRADLLAWREKSGIDPKWIRRNDALRVGRGLYNIPDGETPVARPPAGARLAKHERAVLPTPFDDGHYDGDGDADAPSKPKRAKRVRKGDPEDPQALINMPDYDPTIGERAAPVYVRAWLCEDRNCVGRKPDIESVTEPVCECGQKMFRHSWPKKAR